MRHIFNCFVLLILFSSTSFSYNGSANISTEIYSFETAQVNHIQFYQSIHSRLYLYQKSNKQILFSTYGRWRTDLDNKLESNPQLFVYDLQLTFKEFLKSSKFSLGRQYVYSSVGSALIDGINIKSTLIPNSEISVHAGSEVNRLVPDKIQNFSDHLIAGLKYKYRFDKNFKVGLHFFLRKDEKEITSNRLGLDISKKISLFSIYSRLTYNIQLSSLNEVLLRGSYRMKKWYVSVEGRYRQPLVSSNSLYSIIDSEKYKRGRVDVQYKLNRQTRFVSQLRYSLYNDDNTVAGSFGIRIKSLSFFYNYQNGHGTENSGISGTINRKLNKVTFVYASVNLSRYKIQESYDDLSDAYSTSIGVVRTIMHQWMVRGEWQYLRNAVESSSSRIYVKLSKQFSFR